MSDEKGCSVQDRLPQQGGEGVTAAPRCSRQHRSISRQAPRSHPQRPLLPAGRWLLTAQLAAESPFQRHALDTAGAAVTPRGPFAKQSGLNAAGGTHGHPLTGGRPRPSCSPSARGGCAPGQAPPARNTHRHGAGRAGKHPNGFVPPPHGPAITAHRAGTATRGFTPSAPSPTRSDTAPAASTGTRSHNGAALLFPAVAPRAQAHIQRAPCRGPFRAPRSRAVIRGGCVSGTRSPGVTVPRDSRCGRWVPARPRCAP